MRSSLIEHLSASVYLQPAHIQLLAHTQAAIAAVDAAEAEGLHPVPTAR
jgi:hypothetical protein